MGDGALVGPVCLRRRVPETAVPVPTPSPEAWLHCHVPTFKARLLWERVRLLQRPTRLHHIAWRFCHHSGHMRTTHDALWLVAVAAAWILGYLDAPFWMIAIGCALLAVSIFLELRKSDRYLCGQHPAARVLAQVTVQVGSVLLVYFGGVAVREFT